MPHSTPTQNYMQNRILIPQTNTINSFCSTKYTPNPARSSTVLTKDKSPKIGNNIWGPPGWKFMHYMTFAYPDKPTRKERQDADSFFTSLKSLLPCDSCRKEYTSLLRKFKPQTKSKDSLSRWLVDIHNRVNTRLGKNTITYEQAKTMYCTPEVSICSNT